MKFLCRTWPIDCNAIASPPAILREIGKMMTYETQYRSAAALFLVASVMQTVARHMRGAAKQWHAWLERRQVAAAAFHDFRTMSDRELLDIGITRVDIDRVAWGASDRYPF